MNKKEQQGEGIMHHNKPPFPALTTTQRLHFEIYGYVVIERLFDTTVPSLH